MSDIVQRLRAAAGERYSEGANKGGTAGLMECAADEIDRLRAQLDELEGQEPVATLLKSDPFDDRDGPSFSLADWDRLRALPAYTKLYTSPQPEPVVPED